MENSRQLCKPETKTRVCIIVVNSTNPLSVYITLCKYRKKSSMFTYSHAWKHALGQSGRTYYVIYILKRIIISHYPRELIPTHYLGGLSSPIEDYHLSPGRLTLSAYKRKSDLLSIFGVLHPLLLTPGLFFCF